MRYFSLLFILLFILSACATSTTIPVENRTRLYDKTKDEAVQAAILVLEAEGYSLNTDGIQYGIVKGDKPYSDLATALVGAGRFELSFLITENQDGKTKVTLQPSSYSQNAFGVEAQNTFSGTEIQEAVDRTFVKYNEMIGGGDLGSIATMKADEVNASKRLECNDPQARQTRTVVKRDTPLLQSTRHGAAYFMLLDHGVKVNIYNVTDNFAYVCYGDQKAYIKASLVGKTNTDI